MLNMWIFQLQCQVNRKSQMRNKLETVSTKTGRCGWEHKPCTASGGHDVTDSLIACKTAF